MAWPSRGFLYIASEASFRFETHDSDETYVHGMLLHENGLKTRQRVSRQGIQWFHVLPHSLQCCFGHIVITVRAYVDYVVCTCDKTGATYVC